MKLPPLRYERPASLHAASALLRADATATALAGGQSLIPALRLGEREAGILVDLTRLPELRGIEVGAGAIHIGAGVSMLEVERSPLVVEAAPLLRRVLASVGAVGIRSRATLGGSLAWADPSSQLPATLAVLGTDVETTERTLPAGELQRRANATVLEPGELIVRLRIPVAAGSCGFQLVRRTHLTWPIAGAVAAAAGRDVRLALFGAAGRLVLVGGADSAAESMLAEAASLIDPYDDEKASGWYRRQVLPTLARRALAELGSRGVSTQREAS
ncbi:FAD binding domain-containing protein [Nocardioides sp. GXZ039]|uniref:FAD binding domain-containing protein n=1 Tax=Nocardioides sp. GXZ039 TaxID=3136018 RepID=UPI0030F3F043